MDLTKNPPIWCKDAIPTKLGWCNPKTGELLVAIRLDVEELSNKVEQTESVEEPKEVKKAGRRGRKPKYSK